MPTNRPFFANFFSAFRARTSPTFQAKSSNPASSISPTSLVSTAHTSTSPVTTTATSSTPRTLTTSTKQPSEGPQHSQTVSSPSRATGTPLPFSSATGRYAPYSRSPGTSSPGGNPNLSMSPPANTPMTRGRQRRGSDSSNSSGGFMDALGHEKWYIGGRTAGGDETFYRLGLVSGGQGKRVRSLDRLSL